MCVLGTTSIRTDLSYEYATIWWHYWISWINVCNETCKLDLLKSAGTQRHDLKADVRSDTFLIKLYPPSKSVGHTLKYNVQLNNNWADLKYIYCTGILYCEMYCILCRGGTTIGAGWGGMHTHPFQMLVFLLYWPPPLPTFKFLVPPLILCTVDYVQTYCIRNMINM